MEVEKSIEIAAPPEKVWPFLVEPDKVLQWYRTFQKFEYPTEQREGVGTPIYIEEKAVGPVMKINFVVTEWEQNRRLVIKMESGGGVKGYEQRWSIEPSSSGSKFTLWEQVQLPFGFIGKIMERIGEPMSASTVGQIIAKLKELVEATS